jgi:phosphoglycolate phosphatase-like HAD superfamily hydrolase
MSTLPGPSYKPCIRAVIFDLDGTLLDTESLSDMALLMAFGNSLPLELQEELRRGGNRLPWELKKQLLGKRGDEWVPIAISYAKTNWGISSSFCCVDPPPSSSV